jgi:hypothetical protein
MYERVTDLIARTSPYSKFGHRYLFCAKRTKNHRQKEGLIC